MHRKCNFLYILHISLTSFPNCITNYHVNIGFCLDILTEVKSVPLTCLKSVSLIQPYSIFIQTKLVLNDVLGMT